MKNFNLSPFLACSIPSFAFNAGFCHSGADFEYIKVEEILSWVNTRIRVGISLSTVKTST